MQAAVWFTPLLVFSYAVSIPISLLLRSFDAMLLLAFGQLPGILAPLILIVKPSHIRYWTHVFPSLLCGTTWTATSLTTALILIIPYFPDDGGVGAGIIISWVALTVSIALGVASGLDITTGSTAGHKWVFVLSAGCAALAFCGSVAYKMVRCILIRRPRLS